MAARLIWSNEALNDVSAIAEYISRDSPYHARRVTQEFFTIAEAVVEQPKLGRVVPELNDEHVRERFLYSYCLKIDFDPPCIRLANRTKAGMTPKKNDWTGVRTFLTILP